MQQQLCQPEQLGQQQQQQGQQVMLCPVRLVYETQILVQPGEQIQPNQTLFINPQNPPPWIQNRPQNQVIYMQQLPNNMVSSVPQHMDQNQMYIQNIPNYYPQQMIQMDQLRQMPNMVQMMPNINQITGQNVNNMAQSVSLNVGQNVNSIGPSVTNINNLGQNVSVNVGQNVMPMANVVQNVSQKPVNVGVNIAQNISNDRVYNSNAVIANTIMQNQQTTMTNAAQIQERTVNMNQNLVNMQKVAELQGIRPQNVRQPQVTVSPMQNVKFVPNAGDVRPMSVTNINDIRQVPAQNVADTRNLNSPRQMNVTTISNIPNNVVQANMMNKKVPLPNKPNSVMANQMRHYNQTYYRPIQPRPMSVMPMVQNQYLPIGTQTINVPRPTQPANQNTNEINRKRKSESPDEITKKIPNMGNQPLPTASTISNQVMSIVPNIQNKIVSVVQTDIGVNTNPVHKEVKQIRTVETASTGTQANIAREKPQAVEMRVLPPVVKENVQIESDKLVRNTVFTQARGLLRTEPQIMQPDIISIEKIETVVNPAPIIQNNLPQIAPAEAKVKIEEPVKNEITKASAVPVKLETSTNIESKPKEVKQEVLVKKEEKPIKEVAKPPKVEVKSENGPEVKKPEVTETKPVKTEDKQVKELSKKVTVAISDLKGSEIQIADGSVRKEHSDSFILTHVLDGYVIQESNTAFPIRKPLKEKTIYQNTDLTMDQKKEETPYKHRTEDGKIIKDNSKILSISDLNLNEDDKIKTEVKEADKSEEEHPFANLKPSTIKSWTVDQLASHLSKFKWVETISVLSEHEIDGESLFLVSKQQLVQIGVNETHADLICDFIKKA